MEKMNAKAITTQKLAKNGIVSDEKCKKPRKSAFAGVGKPLKLSSCRSSWLNLASLSAETAGMIKTMYGRKGVIQSACIAGDKLSIHCSAQTNRIIAGAPPKEKTSAKESISTPMVDLTCNMRAANPSKKSKRAATNIRMEATSKWFFKAITMAIQPVKILQQVRKLGMCFFIF